MLPSFKALAFEFIDINPCCRVLNVTHGHVIVLLKRTLQFVFVAAVFADTTVVFLTENLRALILLEKSAVRW